MSTPILENDLLLRAARGERTERTPVWLMRQAGRFDPDYLELRKKCGLELEELFAHAELAAEVTLLPKRLGVDALIIFQDILTPLAPMGARFVFRPGPVLDKPIRSEQHVCDLREFDVEAELPFVAESIRLVKREIGNELPLLGFAGSPLTVAAFMIEGCSPGNALDHTRRMMQSAPAVLHVLLERLSGMTAAYLRCKIAAGVDAVQLFESIGDLLSREEYETFAHPYHQRVFAQLKDLAPRILFVKERPDLDLMAQSGADVLSIGSCIDLAKARQAYGDRLAFQGNVDNTLLRDGTLAEIDAAVERCIRQGGHRGHILNLNHGLHKDTPFDNVCRLIETCRSLRLEATEVEQEMAP